jgi:hypothetical protein
MRFESEKLKSAWRGIHETTLALDLRHIGHLITMQLSGEMIREADATYLHAEIFSRLSLSSMYTLGLESIDSIYYRPMEKSRSQRPVLIINQPQLQPSYNILCELRSQGSQSFGYFSVFWLHKELDLFQCEEHGYVPAAKPCKVGDETLVEGQDPLLPCSLDEAVDDPIEPTNLVTHYPRLDNVNWGPAADGKEPSAQTRQDVRDHIVLKYPSGQKRRLDLVYTCFSQESSSPLLAFNDSNLLTWS